MSPQFLPGSEDVLLGLQFAGSNENQVYVFTLRNGQLVDPVPLLKKATGVRYTPAAGGRLLFVRDFNLYSQGLNLATKSSKVTRNPCRKRRDNGADRALLSVTILHRRVAARPTRPPQVTIFDRRGNRSAQRSPSGGFLAVKLSPMNARARLRSGQSWLLAPNHPYVWASPGNLTMLWSSDASRFLVPRVTGRRASFERRQSDRELANAPDLERLEDVSSDGTTVLFTNGAFASAVFALRLKGTPEQRVPTPVLQTGEWVWNARFSPDARWIVYQAAGQAGQDRGIYVQPFPGPGLRKQLTNTGEYPAWRKDGKEIVYLDAHSIWSLPVDTSSGEVRAGVPAPLLFRSPVSRVWRVAARRIARRLAFLFSAGGRAPYSDGCPSRWLAVARSQTTPTLVFRAQPRLEGGVKAGTPLFGPTVRRFLRHAKSPLPFVCHLGATTERLT